MNLSAADFSVSGIYLDSAARHPLPAGAVARISDYADFLGTHATSQGLADKRERVRRMFAALINADPGEIAFLPSTVLAETTLLQVLDLPRAGRGVVTDALHFSGSLAYYRSLVRAGAPVTIVPHTDGGIDYDRLADAITPETGLVAISSVSHWNGFQHDLAEVCRLAHARGALVYADIIQQAGAMPFDVRASGVDFAACGTYKWLLGDMGLAFLYVRSDCVDLLRRDLRGAGAAGIFEVGTLGASAIEALLYTLPLLADGGCETLESTRARLTTAIDRTFSTLPLVPLTPPGHATPIRAFAGAGLSSAMSHRLESAGIRVTMRDDYLRLSPSWFNSEADIAAVAGAIADALVG